jgi:hypothetical protein
LIVLPRIRLSLHRRALLAGDLRERSFYMPITRKTLKRSIMDIVSDIVDYFAAQNW